MNETDIVYIGLVGKAGSGKDEFCKMLLNNTGRHVIGHRVAFADALKRVTADMFGVDVEVFHNRDMKEVEVEDLKMTPRKMLQWFGTDVVRSINPDHWVERMNKEVVDVIMNYRKSTGVMLNYPHIFIDYDGKAGDKNCPRGATHLIVVPDVRFENEVDWIVDGGGVIFNIERDDPDVGELDTQHASETSVDYSKWDVVDNNGSLQSLNRKSISILNAMGLR